MLITLNLQAYHLILLDPIRLHRRPDYRYHHLLHLHYHYSPFHQESSTHSIDR